MLSIRFRGVLLGLCVWMVVLAASEQSAEAQLLRRLFGRHHRRRCVKLTTLACEGWVCPNNELEQVFATGTMPPTCLFSYYEATVCESNSHVVIEGPCNHPTGQCSGECENCFNVDYYVVVPSNSTESVNVVYDRLIGLSNYDQIQVGDLKFPSEGMTEYVSFKLPSNEETQRAAVRRLSFGGKTFAVAIEVSNPAESDACAQNVRYVGSNNRIVTMEAKLCFGDQQQTNYMFPVVLLNPIPTKK